MDEAVLEILCYFAIGLFSILMLLAIVGGG